MARKNEQTKNIAYECLTKNQEYLHNSLRGNIITFATGDAGTGKTFISTAFGLNLLNSAQIEKLILIRPAVEAGEKIGFIPGGINEKMEPFLLPIYDVVREFLGQNSVNKLLGDGKIEIIPLAYMRGRTYKNSFVIFDEAQNATYDQIKMVLTRIGIGSRMVICGDPKQNDLNGKSGLTKICSKVAGVDGIGSINFTKEDSVRHPIVRLILDKLDG